MRNGTLVGCRPDVNPRIRGSCRAGRGAANHLLFGPYPQPGRVSVRLHRPATGRTWTVTLTPALYQAAPPPVSAKLLKGDIAYVQLPGFFPGAADQVLQAITNLAKGAKLRGLILDQRGNGGGTPAEVSRLLGAFIHGAAYAYDCDVHGSCPVTYTDKTSRCCTCRWSC